MIWVRQRIPKQHMVQTKLTGKPIDVINQYTVIPSRVEEMGPYTVNHLIFESDFFGYFPEHQRRMKNNMSNLIIICPIAETCRVVHLLLIIRYLLKFLVKAQI